MTNILKWRPSKKDLPIFMIFIAYFAYSAWWKYHRWMCLTPSMDYHSYLQMFWNSRNGDWLQYNGLKQDVRMMFQYHFALILIPLAYVYFLIPHQLTLYFTSTFFLALSVFPLYYIAKHFLKSTLAAYLVVGIFLLYPPYVNVDLEGFAEELFSVPFLLFAIYFLIKGKKWLYILFVILILSLRINMSAAVFSLGILAFIWEFMLTRGVKISGNKFIGFLNRYKWALGTMVLSVLWFLFIIFVIGKYFPTPIEKHQSGSYIWGFFNGYGSTPEEIIRTLLTRPDIVMQKTFIPQKITYIRELFGPLKYLPFLSPYTIFAGPIFLQNFLSSNLRLSAVYNYYQASMIPFMFLGFIHSLSWIPKVISHISNKKFDRKILEILLASGILAALIFYDLTALPARRLPFNSYYNPAFVSRSHKDIEYKRVIDRIPVSFKVGSDEKFMEHIAERKFYYDSGEYELLRPEIILTDAYEKVDISAGILMSGNYSRVFDHYYLYLYARNDVVREYSLQDNISLDKDREYIVYVPSGVKVYRMWNCAAKFTVTCDIDPPDTVKLEPNSTSLYYKKDFAQPFIAASSKLDKITFGGASIGNPEGNLLVKVVEDNNNSPTGKELFSKSIEMQHLSHETDIVKIDTLLPNLNIGSKYWFVLNMDTQNSDADRYDIARVKSPDGIALELPLNTMKGSKDWGSSEDESRYALDSGFYFSDAFGNIEVNADHMGFVTLSDKSLLVSGNGEKVQKALEELKLNYPLMFSKVVVVSTTL